MFFNRRPADYIVLYAIVNLVFKGNYYIRTAPEDYLARTR